MAIFRLYYRIEVKDRYGRVKKRTRLHKADSFTLQFLGAVGGWLTHAYLAENAVYSGPCKNTLGSTMYYVVSSPAMWGFTAVFAADDNDDYGIVVGTGTTPPTNVDYKLETQIAHGTGAGELDYGTHSFTTPQVVGSNVDMVISRTFYNGSGAKVTISEIGVYEYSARPHYGTDSACIIRDVITPVDVENGETVSVQYTLRTTV